MAKFIEEKAEPGLSHKQLNIRLDGVMNEFKNSIRKMERLDRDIEQIALNILPPKDWSSEHDELSKDRDRGNNNACTVHIIIKMTPFVTSTAQKRHTRKTFSVMRFYRKNN